MKQTLLELTQGILSAMESDEINSINDTVESYAVAVLLRDVFYDMATELGLSQHQTLFELNASGQPTQPTLMTLPSTVTEWEWIEYDNRDDGDTLADYRRVSFMPLDQFLSMQNSLRDSPDADQMSFTSNGETFEVMYTNNCHPTYFTTFDDSTFLFDSYDSGIDSTLQKSKTRCSGAVVPTFTLDDSFTPDLEPKQFAYYRNRAKVRAFAEFKQVSNAEAARETRNQKIAIQKHKRISPDLPAVMKVGSRWGRKGQRPNAMIDAMKRGS